MKIYNKIILKWNDNTNRFDTIYEDSYEHSGRVDYAAKKKGGEGDPMREYGGPTPEAIGRWRKVSDIASEVQNIETQLTQQAREWSSAQSEGLTSTKNIASVNDRIAQAEVAKADINKRYWGKNKELGDRILKEQVKEIKAAATEEHGRLAASTNIGNMIDANLKDQADRENTIFGVRKKSLDASNQILQTAQKQVQVGDLSADQGNKIAGLMAQMNAEGLSAADVAKIRSDIEAELVDQIGQGNDAYAEQLQNVGKMGETRVLEEETMARSKEKLAGMDKLTGGMVGKAQAFQKQFQGANKKITGTFAVLGLIMALMAAIGAQTDMVGNKFGAIGVNEFKGPLIEATADAQKLGYGFEEVASTVTALSGEFGVSFGEATKMSGAVLDTAKAIGMSTENAAKLTGQLMLTSGLSAEGAQNFMKQAAGMAKAAGVAPGAVLEDMASSSGDIANFTKGSGENMVKAAVGAKAMGMSLGDVAKAAEGLLSFQDSITKEMTASAMIGRELNLQKAREMALAGDLVGVQNEMLKQVGSEAEFNEMNVLQRQALAAAMGMEVAQLQKMVSHAGKSNAELMAMSDVDISEIVSEDAIGQVTLITNQLKAFGTQVLGIVASVANLGGVFGTLPAPMAAIIAGLIGLGVYFAFVVGKTYMQSAANKFLAKSIDSVTAAEIKRKAVGGGAPGTATPSKGGGMMGKMKGMKMPSASTMLKGAAAILILSAALLVAAVAFRAFGGVEWSAVAKGVVGLSSLAVIAALLGMAAANILTGAFAIGVLSLALIPMAYAFSLLENIDFGTMMGFSLAVTLLGVAAAGLSFIAPFIMVGAAALGVLGVGLMSLGLGIGMTLPHLVEFGSIMGQLIPQVQGIDLLAGSLTNLAAGLFMVAAAGLLAAPALKLLGATGLLGGGIGETTKSEGPVEEGPSETELLQLELVEIKNHLKTLVTGFGESPGETDYLTGIGKETANAVKSSKFTAVVDKGFV